MHSQTLKDIYLEAPFSINFIKKFEIRQEVGEHGYLHVVCILKEPIEYNIYSLGFDTTI